MPIHPRAGRSSRYGTWDYEIVDALKPAAGEAIVPKARYSGFAGTNLEQLLRARGITTLLLVGVNTNVCVESTLRDAYHREFFAVMVPDATLQAGSDFIFEATVFNVQRFFGWTAPSEAVVRALRVIGAAIRCMRLREPRGSPIGVTICAVDKRISPMRKRQSRACGTITSGAGSATCRGGFHDHTIALESLVEREQAGTLQ